ncbi:lipoyl(octanoyl) transferase LipB [Curtobacterium herbarum]|uniref:Octanoyltransferase n=1 Tax=Curtobacterium herbarum TaxID=150122 RepID=A0ABP4K377_9MICO|nr:lipoyl(octanoyl) transferase LipB [Curtobacterium herbarum]MBM7475101.1 lipoyl(octanoyl) transferase [Curtobacterium herbarum]MCS6543019.1 lipoyl(octanoyl) transferase LipB [Curtobacterium herbarum]
MPEIEIVRWTQPLPYTDGLALQHALRADVLAGRSPGALVVCEHPPVYTAGRRTEPSDLPTDGSPVVETDRGGRITWHGPGQLVAYPIVRLPEPLDVVAWVRSLEQVLIDAAASVGVTAGRVSGRSGAWVGTGSTAAKTGAVGLHVAQGISTHGIALNCSNSLDAYAAIVPCGIADAGVTTLSRAAGRPVSVADVTDAVTDGVLRALAGERPRSETGGQDPASGRSAAVTGLPAGASTTTGPSTGTSTSTSTSTSHRQETAA